MKVEKSAGEFLKKSETFDAIMNKLYNYSNLYVKVKSYVYSIYNITIHIGDCFHISNYFFQNVILAWFGHTVKVVHFQVFQKYLIQYFHNIHSHYKVLLKSNGEGYLIFREGILRHNKSKMCSAVNCEPKDRIKSGPMHLNKQYQCIYINDILVKYYFWPHIFQILFKNIVVIIIGAIISYQKFEAELSTYFEVVYMWYDMPV